ncbi:hypothetical protein [Thermocatellispora tengchongensis]|uniref:hypothetical protein n=1 Tax=Thermocatellispora tengchongensis TaxID=1073253 RepID=UPI00363025B7
MAGPREVPGLIALLEIKPRSRSVLADPALGARAWREISDPIRDRQDEQRIMVYSQDPWIQRELAARHPALLRGSAARWTDSVAWDEPVPPGPATPAGGRPCSPRRPRAS